MPNKTGKIQKEIYKNMTYIQKWEEAKKLYRTARILKRAGVKELHPDWSDEQIDDKVREIFLYARS